MSQRLSPFDRRTWRDFIDRARDWRRAPSDRSALNFEKVARSAFAAMLPVPERSEPAKTIASAVLLGKRFHKSTFLDRDRQWPEILAGLSVIETALAPPAPANLYYLRED